MRAYRLPSPAPLPASASSDPPAPAFPVAASPEQQTEVITVPLPPGWARSGLVNKKKLTATTADMTRSSNTHPDVPGQGLYFSGELDTLLLQLLPFLHIAAQLQFLFSRLIHRTFQHLDLILLVLDQLTFQLYLAGGCKKKKKE